MGRLDAPEGARELTRAFEILTDRLAPGARVLDRAHQLARLEPAVVAEVERLARALRREPEIIATSGHALLVAKRSA